MFLVPRKRGLTPLFRPLCSFVQANAPVVALPKHIEHGAQPLGINVQTLVQHVGTDGIGQGLGAGRVVDAQEGVVGLRKANAFALERLGQHAVAIAVKLQAKRCPGGNSQIAQAQLGADEIEVVVQALAGVPTQISLATGLVVPWAVTSQDDAWYYLFGSGSSGLGLV